MGIRQPEPEWSDELKGPARSKALGTAVHLTLEKHYENKGPDWIWFPGQVAASGVHLLPERHDALAVESPMLGRSIGPGHDGEERFVIDVGGVPWLGYKDLTDYSSDGTTTPALYDYKSTKSIKNWAKSTDELKADLQANLYAFDTMNELDVDEVKCRWVYFETDRVRRAEPRDFVIHRDGAITVIETAAEIAKELDAIDHIDQAPMNPSACPDFGGCEFHVKAGGPCSASVPVGALIQARVPKKGSNQMPLNRTALASHMAGVTGVAPATTTAPADAPPAQTTTAPPTNEQTNLAPAGQTENAPARRPGRPARTGGAKGGTFADLALALTEAEANHAEATASLEAAKENMRKALA
jgi:hypothetical protein